MLVIKSDILFFLGIALLPFENMFFAPSAGWGALTPLVFALYVLLNIRYLNRILYKYKKLFFLILWVILITLINFLFIDSYFSAAVTRFINAFISLGLGIVNLIAFDVYFIEKNGSNEKVEQILLVVYTISILVGFVQYFTIKYNIDFIRLLDHILSKRTYLHVNRIQFTFTEPSFIGMHLYGVLLPVYLYGKNKKILRLIIAYALIAIVFFSGVRIVVDTLVVAVIFILHRIDLKKAKNIIIILGTSISLILVGTYLYNNNLRVRNIVNTGVYADGSFASRYFRINASIKGYRNNFVHAVLGYGLGQEVYPLADGYYEACDEYKSSYMNEVNALRSAIQSREESASFCLFIRIASECGLIVLTLILLYLCVYYNREKNSNWRAMILSAVYLYFQFEPFAFYTSWLVFVLLEARHIKTEIL